MDTWSRGRSGTSWDWHSHTRSIPRGRRGVRSHCRCCPKQWPLAVLESTKDQFRTVKKLISAREVEYVVCATDAGREGELIFRFIYEAAGCRKPVRRLWISSLTPGAIKAGLQVMKDGRAYDSLAAAARGRAQADWLVGMNLSRAYTIAARRYLLRRQGADADVGDARRTRKGDPRVRPRDVLRSPRHVRRHALHGHMVQARRGPLQRVQAAPARRAERAGHRRPCEARRHEGLSSP